ncbi:hypothetical protein Patl1_04531 [Pistacia atlantica]|uniref:Uncharacterized protein n=1 Tax=Pistacia atlantica TaxID=434234 RepID=A0ACC1BP75_9ROSI|nr:hypothetical protein Patl1_04531 [Pistacia atlantica]
MSSNGGRISRFDVALMKSMQQKGNASVAESASASGNKCNNRSVWSTVGDVNNQTVKRINGDDQKRRKEEKDEILFNLICWAPN